MVAGTSGGATGSPSRSPAARWCSIRATRDAFDPFYKFWTYARDWQTNKNRWWTEPFAELDAETMEAAITTLNDLGVAVYEQRPDAESLILTNSAPTGAGHFGLKTEIASEASESGPGSTLWRKKPRLPTPVTTPCTVTTWPSSSDHNPVPWTS